MFKKIALAAALTATASFATWDYFPVQEAHKGQAEIHFDYMMQDDLSRGALSAGARYTIVQNFEAGLIVPFVLFTSWDGEDMKQDGLADLQLMLRYQFMPIMNAFLDVSIPTCNEDLCGEDGPFGFHFGVQFSQKFGMVDFGSELGLALETKGDDKTTPPWDMNLGLEADFAVSEMVVPYVGIDINMLLGKYTVDGENMGDSHTGDMGFAPYLGLTFNINPMFYAGAQAQFCFGDDYYGEEMLTILTAKVGVNF